jgi:hypothetical protein
VAPASVGGALLHAAPRSSGSVSGAGGGSVGSGSGAMGAAEDEAKPLLGYGPRGALGAQVGRLLAARHTGTGRAVLAAAVSVTWMCFSSLLILLNKHILKDLKFGCAQGAPPAPEPSSGLGGATGLAS